jgi:hypothetical protein
MILNTILKSDILSRVPAKNAFRRKTSPNVPNIAICWIRFIRCYPMLFPAPAENIEDCRLKIEDLWNSAYFILNACCLPEEGESSRRIDPRPGYIPRYTINQSQRDQLLKR